MANISVSATKKAILIDLCSDYHLWWDKWNVVWSLRHCARILLLSIAVQHYHIFCIR